MMLEVAPNFAGDALLVLAGVALAALGGELFLRGVLGMAAWLRLPKLLVATTLAACATSSPELTVSTVAALAGQPEIGLGDALGSNVVNIALIFGLALLFGAMPAERKALKRDLTFALFIPLATVGMALDGEISRAEGVLLLAALMLWMALTLRSGAEQRVEAGPDLVPPRKGRIILLALSGLGGLVLAGHFFVSGASGIASALGIPAYVIGATVVALGTSLPELVTVLLARWRGHDEVGVGTLLGSNLFNGMAIAGLAAAIHPIRVSPAGVTVTLAMGVASLLLIVPDSAGVIARWRGVLLLLLYCGFVLLTTGVVRLA